MFCWMRERESFFIAKDFHIFQVSGYVISITAHIPTEPGNLRDMLILFNNSFPGLIKSSERLIKSWERVIKSWERVIKSWERVIKSWRLIKSLEPLIKSWERLIKSLERLIMSSERLIKSSERHILCRRNELLTGYPVPIKLVMTKPLYTLL